MRPLKTYIVIILLNFSFIFSFAQGETRKGYKIKSDTIVFIFNVNDYPNIKNADFKVKSVYVSGEFNEWSKHNSKWIMDKKNDSIHELKKELSYFSSDFDWEFKYVINAEHWAEPQANFENIVPIKSKRGKPLTTFNLKLFSAFETENGNAHFYLKGYEDAKEVILSGTFNRWDERIFKMNKTEIGWEISLQLRPDVYEYKFIVDGHWMQDPNNPSKTMNEFGGYNSVINIQKNITFKLCDFSDAETVILSGVFNDWDEEDYAMKKVNGCWVYDLILSGGKYHYKFIVDGHWITDPQNPVKEYDWDGNINSVCMVK